MRYAYYTGCAAKGTSPELHHSTLAVAEKLGIQLDEMKSAACCGAGVVEEHDPDLSRALNARTLALAEKQGLDILTVCNICTQQLASVNKELKEKPALLEKTNEVLGKVGLSYKGTVNVTHLLWVLVRDYGIEKLKAQVTNPLTGWKIAPFYGCQILRPEEVLGFEDPYNPQSIEDIIKALGADPVDYDEKVKCCGFLIDTIQESTAVGMTGRCLAGAKRAGADCVVTPCPLCHLNLDAYQGQAANKVGVTLDMPVFHLPQLVGVALGIQTVTLRLTKNFVSPYRLVHKVAR